MVDLHVLGLVEDHVGIKVCQLILIQSVLIIQIHQHRCGDPFVVRAIHAADIALIQADVLQR